MPELELWHDWVDAALQNDVRDGIGRLFHEIDDEVASRNPKCDISGRCCKFDSYGHRLYVTGLEIAWLCTQLDEAGRSNLKLAELPQLDGCPFQVHGLCSVHRLRPLGCRIYFCDPNAQDWQAPIYERYLSEIRKLHEQFGIEYRYMEWRVGLAEFRDSQCD